MYSHPRYRSHEQSAAHQKPGAGAWASKLNLPRTTLSQRIMLGVGALLAVMLVFGGMAIWQMGRASSAANLLAGAVVPEESLVNDIGIDSAAMRLASRTYSLTSDPKELKSTNAASAALHTSLDKARALAERHPELELLSRNTAIAAEQLNAYVAQVEETRKNVEQAAQLGDKADTDDAFIKATAQIAAERRKAGAAFDATVAGIQRDSMAQIEEISSTSQRNLRTSTEIITVGLILIVIVAPAVIFSLTRKVKHLAPFLSMVDNSPANFMFAGPDLKIRYANPVCLRSLGSLQHLLQFPADEILGRSIDLFHKDASGINGVLSNPANLPHKTVVEFGTETLDLFFSGVHDQDGNFIGIMVSWSIITEKVAQEKHEKELTENLRHVIEKVAANAQTLGSASEELAANSEQMVGNAEETAAQAGVVSSAAEEVSRNVRTAATGTEAMSASIREIAKNAQDAAKVAATAVKTAETANATISKLGDSSAEIGKVVKVITSITRQTNLLALNATIEAARAGEAGKGFAVVANEVKELAKETARATEDISLKIEAIQTATQSAVAAIAEIGGVIDKINDYQNTIATAVEEQTATTNEISRNVTEAARGSAEIAQNIIGVATTAKCTTSGASDTQKASAELSRMAAELQGLVSTVSRQ
jgi:hypothetical protein